MIWKCRVWNFFVFRSGIDFFFFFQGFCVALKYLHQDGGVTLHSLGFQPATHINLNQLVGSENRESRHSSRYTNFRNLLRQSDIMLQGPFNNNTVLQNRPFVEPTNKSIHFFLLITQSIIYNDLAQNPNFKTTSTRCRAREKSVAFY